MRPRYGAVDGTGSGRDRLHSRCGGDSGDSDSGGGARLFVYGVDWSSS